MIKAVSRQVLEVFDTGNAYFEKAWLMVSPEFSSAAEERLEAEAEDYLVAVEPPAALRHRRHHLGRFVSFFAAASFGGLITAALLQLYW